MRRLLRRSVAARLESEGPLVLALSGGLDSAAIACLAEDLHRARGLACTPWRRANPLPRSPAATRCLRASSTA